MTSFEALCGRLCRLLTCWYRTWRAVDRWAKVASRLLENSRVDQVEIDDAQCSYAYQWRREVSFTLEDRILIKVSLAKGGEGFGKRAKLSPRYIRSFEMLELIGKAAYKLTLLPNLSVVQPVFHVSMMKYMPNGSCKLLYEGLDFRPDLF